MVQDLILHLMVGSDRAPDGAGSDPAPDGAGPDPQDQDQTPCLI